MAEYAIGVCGFGRCGSSMVMQMLIAGGCPVHGEVAAVSGELVGGFPAVFEAGPITGAVKLLDSALYFGIPAAKAWRFVWIDRDPLEQARSHVKFVKAFERLAEPDHVVAAKFITSYGRDRAKAIARLRSASAVVLVLRYERVLADPWRGARQLKRLLWPPLDVAAAAAAVHSRDGKCRPDLSVELAGLTGHADGT